VDLYLIHWPGPNYCCDTWQALEELVDQGKTLSIGVSNFAEEHLATIDSVATIPPAVNQIELHPRRQQPEVVSACRKRGIVVQAWGPVMRGHADEVPELADIARRHGKSAAQVSIRWILQQGFITIPKSVHPKRLREDADVFDFELSDEEMRLIDGLDRDEHAH
jgi:methylglyoxal/glyoxal reductase